MDAPDISTKIKSAIKAKLCELEAYVDDELPGKIKFATVLQICVNFISYTQPAYICVLVHILSIWIDSKLVSMDSS